MVNNENEDNKLIKKEPSFFQKIINFLFGTKEIKEKSEVEEVKENEEIVSEENEVVAEELENYTEDDIIKLQEDVESGKTNSNSLTRIQTSLLFSLYMEQIEKLKKSNEEKRQKLLEYRNSMNKWL